MASASRASSTSGKPLSELNLPEIALLVAIVRGPSEYDPRRHPEHTLERRNNLVAQAARRAERDQRRGRRACDHAPLGAADAKRGARPITRRFSISCAASCAVITRDDDLTEAVSVVSRRSIRCCREGREVARRRARALEKSGEGVAGSRGRRRRDVSAGPARFSAWRWPRPRPSMASNRALDAQKDHRVRSPKP